jgi:hypothetical protein
LQRKNVKWNIDRLVFVLSLKCKAAESKLFTVTRRLKAGIVEEEKMPIAE